MLRFKCLAPAGRVENKQGIYLIQNGDNKSVWVRVGNSFVKRGNRKNREIAKVIDCVKLGNGVTHIFYELAIQPANTGKQIYEGRFSLAADVFFHTFTA